MRKSLSIFLVALSLFVTGSVALGQGFAGWYDIEPATRFKQQVWFNGAITADTDLTLGDDLTVVDDFTAADYFATQQSAQTITFGGTITPTGTYHQITAAAARGTSSVAGVSTAGRLIVLVNVGSNTITLTDTGTLKLSGNIALGQYDSLELISDGTNWIQLATTNN